MKGLKSSIVLMGLALMSLSFTACNITVDTEQNSETEDFKGSYDATWSSLRQHQTPQWFADAKFGIYTHWGLSSVRYMEEHGDKDLEELIELFNPEKFDPDEWAKLFKAAGAKFAGPVAWHGSNYLHWDSEFSDLNTVDRNPGIDIVAEMEKAVRKAGMKFMFSYHNSFDDEWIKFAKEGVDLFSPDIFWVDAGFGGTKAGHHMKVLDNSKYIGQSDEFPAMLPERFQQEFISYYYNNAEREEKEVDFLYKSHDIPPGVAMRDLENGMLNQIAYDTWITDMDMNVPPDWATHGWFYREGVPQRTGNDIIDILVDVVSKNGILLLNVGPMADGTFAEETRTYLLEVGDWLKVNGEAIYGASPWFIYGEGASEAPTGSYSMHHNNHFAQVKFGEEDIRFTSNGPYLYAICLGVPAEGLTVKSLNTSYKVKEGGITSVSLLGLDAPLTWEHTEEGLTIDLPENVPSQHALVFKIERK